MLGSQTFLVPVLSPKGQHLTTQGLELPLGHCLPCVLESPFEMEFNTNTVVALGVDEEAILASLTTIFETVTSSLTITLVLFISVALVVEFSTI